MYTYRQIFKQAFEVAWKNPAIWFFGFMVAFLGSSGEAGLFLSSYGVSEQSLLLSFWQGLFEGGLANFQALTVAISDNPLYLILLLLLGMIILAVSAFIVWLIFVSQAALISQGIKILNKKPATWKNSFNLGIQKFWPVLGVNILVQIVAAVLAALSAVLLVLRFPGSGLVFIVVFNIVLLAIIITSFVGKFALFEVVLKNRKLMDALNGAWQLFKKNWLISIEIAILLFLIYWAVNLLLFYLTSLALFYAVDLFIGVIPVFILILLVLFAVAVAVEVLLTIFYWTSWAIAFELISSPRQLLWSRIKKGFSRK